jgi:hypothetical protein
MSLPASRPSRRQLGVGALALGALGIVFGSSTALASAYGIAASPVEYFRLPGERTVTLASAIEL